MNDDGYVGEARPIWSEAWPTTPGNYWFYGVRRRQEDKPQVWFVRVRVIPVMLQYLAYEAEDRRMHESEGAKGLWLPATVPLPPS